MEPKTEKDGTLIWEGTAADAVEVALASGEVLTVHGPVALLPSGVVLVPGVDGATFALSPGAWGQIHPAGSRHRPRPLLVRADRLSRGPAPWGTATRMRWLAVVRAVGSLGVASGVWYFC